MIVKIFQTQTEIIYKGNDVFLVRKKVVFLAKIGD
jgi:hypothetical protein